MLGSERSYKAALKSTFVIKNHQPVKGLKLPVFDRFKNIMDVHIPRIQEIGTGIMSVSGDHTLVLS